MSFGRWWHARDRRHWSGKPGEAQQHAQAYRGSIYPGSKHQVRQEWTAARLSTSQVSTELLRARNKDANREVSEGKTDFEPLIFFFLRRLTRSDE